MRHPWPALVACILAACGSKDPPAASSVLITLDTTRADALGAFGGTAATPALDRLATRGVIFERALTVAPLTLPAHASMLTGLYPPRHGIRDNGFAPLPQSARTVAEKARAAGFQTAAFVAAVVLEPTFALDQGFDVFDAPQALETPSTHIGHRAGDEVIANALEWLHHRKAGQPFFLWVHLFEPHDPYTAPEDLLEAHDGNAYLAEVALLDRFLAPLLKELEELEDPTSLLVVADHGEGLGEHREETHGYFLYQGTLAVPMVLVRSDGARAAERSPAVVSVVDVAPTLCAAMGLLPENDIDGVSLFEGDPEATRGVYFESYAGHLSFGWTPIAGWADARGKYIHSSNPEFYETLSDPGEQNNLMDSHPDVEDYRRSLAQLGELQSLPSEKSAQVAPELMDQIRALGYASTGASVEELPKPLDENEGPNPHDSSLELQRTLMAADIYNQGRTEPALRLFDSILKKNPGNLRSLEMRINCLLLLQRNAEAIEPLQEYLRRTPGRAIDHFNLAVCLHGEGRAEDAIESYRRALQRESNRPAWLPDFLGLLRSQGLGEEARRWNRRFSAPSGSPPGS